MDNGEEIFSGYKKDNIASFLFSGEFVLEYSTKSLDASINQTVAINEMFSLTSS